MQCFDGYMGSILIVDLSARHASGIPLPAAYCARLLSGKALAAQILLDHMTGEETALSAENILVIASALLTGTGAPGSARFDVASLSPKDDLPGFSNCGGNFGLNLKWAGYDAVLLKGKCEKPCWLEISGEGVIFHDAADLWGLGTGACREQLRNKLEQPFCSVCIGPAGENLIEFASLLADGHSTGRAGFGAVLGWKQLKAITVTGNRKIPLHEEAGVSEINRRWYAQLREVSSGAAEPGSCTACPLHCIRHSRGENPLLEELGMDVIAAETAAQGSADPEVYRAIASGKRPAAAPPVQKGKGGKRRNVSDRRILEAFGLTEDPQGFCKNYAEAVCVLGQCMFTVNGLVPERKERPLPAMIRSVTGKQLTLEDLLRIGQCSRELEQQVRKRFENKITSAD